MKKMNFKWSFTMFALAAASVLTSCDKDEMRPMMQETSHHFTLENVSMPKMYVESGYFMMTDTESPVIMPGEEVSIKFKAGKGQALMFVTMYGKSKDWFIAPMHPGLKLFDMDGKAMVGDVSEQLCIWDNGTKMENGEVEMKNIMKVTEVQAAEVMRAVLAFDEMTSEFTLTITNISKGTAHETPFSPGVWAVSYFNGKGLVVEKPFFTPGEKSNPEVSEIAHSGNIEPLKMKVMEETGIFTGVSPVLLVVYNGDMNPIYELGKKASSGLKQLAESGNAMELKEYLMKMPGVKSVQVLGDAPIVPGQKVMGTYMATEEDKIAFATMYGFSNDWFYANDATIKAQYKGNITEMVKLLDAGTAVSQFPGAGNKQGLFGGMPMAEDKTVSMVGDMYQVPAVNQVLKVTIE